MNVQFYPINPKYPQNNTINHSYSSPTFKGVNGDTFESENKTPKTNDSILKRLGSYFSKEKTIVYIDKSEAIEILKNAGFNTDTMELRRLLELLEEKKGYHKSTITNMVEMRKRANDEHLPNIVALCCVNSWGGGKINYESQRAFLETSIKLLDMGFSSNDVDNILWNLNLRAKNYPPETAKLLTLDLPEEEDKYLLADFVQFRWNATVRKKDSEKDSSKVKLNMEHFNAITDAFKTNPGLHNKDDLNLFEKSYNLNLENPDTLNLIFKFAKYCSPEDLHTTREIYTFKNHAKIVKYGEELREEDKSNFYNGIAYSTCEQASEIFMELFPHLKENGQTPLWLARCISSCIIHLCGEIIEPNLEYLRNNINDEMTEYYLRRFSRGRNIEDKNFPIMKKCIDLGAHKQWLSHQFEEQDFPFYEVTVDNIEEIFKEALAKGHTPAFILPAYATDNSELMLDLMENAGKKRTTLGAIQDPITDYEIIHLLSNNAKKVINVVNLIGKDTFVQLFNKNSNDVEDYIEDLGSKNYDIDEVQPLIELINPKESTRVKELEQRVKELKTELRGVTDEAERRKLIEEINKVSKAKNTIINNQIKDPEQKIKTAQIYLSLLKNEVASDGDWYDIVGFDYTIANKIIQYLNPKTEEEKEEYRKKLNELIWESLEIDYPEKVKDKFDFSKSNYVEKMFIYDEDFKDNFKILVNAINDYPEESVEHALDHLNVNKKTKKTFKKYKLNYDKWTSYNPNLKLEITLQNDYEKSSRNAITNIEKELSDTFFQTIPETEQKKIIAAIEKAGFRFIQNDEAIYDENGYYEGSRQVKNLYKGDNPIDFKDLSNVIKAIAGEFASNEFWMHRNSNPAIENAKETFKDHIGLRYEEVKSIKQSSGTTQSNITIQKANMYDIPHSLFLGNDASCCTSVGSFNSWSAPQYIKHKFVQCIELKDGDRYVGNTMIYPAIINGQPVLLLDNIELKPRYQYDENIENGICEFARMLTREFGKPNMEIWAGPNRHKLDMKNFELRHNENVSLIGNTDEEGIYADFKGEEYTSHETYNDDFYRLKK